MTAPAPCSSGIPANRPQSSSAQDGERVAAGRAAQDEIHHQALLLALAHCVAASAQAGRASCRPWGSGVERRMRGGRRRRIEAAHCGRRSVFKAGRNCGECNRGKLEHGQNHTPLKKLDDTGAGTHLYLGDFCVSPLSSKLRFSVNRSTPSGRFHGSLDRLPMRQASRRSFTTTGCRAGLAGRAAPGGVIQIIARACEMAQVDCREMNYGLPQSRQSCRRFSLPWNVENGHDRVEDDDDRTDAGRPA